LFALAATCTVLLAGPARPRLPGVVRLLLVLGAALIAAAVATAMVALGYHYFTDTVAGTAVAIGMVLLTALLIDRAARAPRAGSRGDPGVPISVTTPPGVSTRSAGQN
jgi:membrane-associated phospholipid phosphatase